MGTKDIWITVRVRSVLINIRRKKLFKVGDLFALYLMWYGLGRGAIIEPLRTGGAEFDALRVFGLPVNIYLSLILFLGGGALLMYLKNKRHRSCHSRIIGGGVRPVFG